MVKLILTISELARKSITRPTFRVFVLSPVILRFNSFSFSFSFFSFLFFFEGGGGGGRFLPEKEKEKGQIAATSAKARFASFSCAFRYVTLVNFA